MSLWGRPFRKHKRDSRLNVVPRKEASTAPKPVTVWVRLLTWIRQVQTAKAHPARLPQGLAQARSARLGANGKTGEHSGASDDGDGALTVVFGQEGGGGFDAVAVVDQDDRIERVSRPQSSHSSRGGRRWCKPSLCSRIAAVRRSATCKSAPGFRAGRDSRARPAVPVRSSAGCARGPRGPATLCRRGPDRWVYVPWRGRYRTSHRQVSPLPHQVKPE